MYFHITTIGTLLLLLEYASSTKIITAHEWTTVTYDWGNSIPFNESYAKETGSYIMENNIITGVKFYQNRIFATVPRWRIGVPSTLNELILSQSSNDNGNSSTTSTTTSDSPLLKPYPSWNMQEPNNCSAIQYTQSIEIDPSNGYMWILDTGYKYFSDDSSYYNQSENENKYAEYNIPDSTCAPKLVIWDINNDKLIRSYIFPDSIAKHNYTFLSDIVLDIRNQRAFIADQFGVPFLGGIIMYDFQNNTSLRFANKDTMQPDQGLNSPALTVHVDGVNVSAYSGTASIAITPANYNSASTSSGDDEYVYFGPFSSFRTYRVLTSDIMNNNSNGIEYIGNRSSQTDHIIFSNNNYLYFAPLSENAIYRVHHSKMINSNNTSNGNWIKENSELIVKNDTILEWIDMFAWPDISRDNNNCNNSDIDGYIFFTTTRLEKYFTRTMDWTGGEGSNIKINKIKVNQRSYLYNGSCQTNDNSNNNHGHNDNNPFGLTEIIVIAAVGGIIVICCIAVIIWQCKKRRNRNSYENSPFEKLAD